MPRRQCLELMGKGALAALFIFNGCAGNTNYTSDLTESLATDSSPLTSLSKIRVSLMIVVPRERIVRQISVKRGSSVLSAIKKAFSYFRTAPADNLAAETTIEGISGHWQYLINGSIPRTYAGVTFLNSDSKIVLRLF